MPFGRKKDDAGADDGNRQALFANRKGGGGGGGNNPYAQGPPPSDPYSQGPPPQRPAGGLPPGPKGGAGLPSGPRGGGGGLPPGPRGGGAGLPSGPRGGGGGGGLPGGPAPRKSGNPYGNEKAGGNPYGNAPPSGNPYGGMQEKGDRYGGGGGGGDRYGGGGGDRYGGGGGGGGGDRYGGGDDRAGGGYGANRYGGQSGYGGGGDRYGTGGGRSGDRYGGGGGRGGYGQDDDGDRDALFSGAQDRYAKQKAGAGGPPPPYSEQAGGGGYGSSYGDTSYGEPGPRYQDRQLTAEEQEEEDVQGVKDQIRTMKREDVSSTRNALRVAAMAEETGRDTLQRLGQQGEHIHNTEKNLDLAHNQNRLAEERARELKTLNKSMFAVHVSNPFTSGRRARARDQEVIDKHLDERERREETRSKAYQSEARMTNAMNEIDKAGSNRKAGQSSLAERAKYQFEADSEDEDMENEIDANLDLLSGAAGRLNKLAHATGKEVDEQNKQLEVIAGKSDRVDLGLASNTARLDRF